MLLRLVRTHLAPYKRRWLAAIVALQFVGTVAMLYLPSLNADIIDKGVAVGDTDYIVRTGAVMLAVSLLQIVCSVAAVWFAARTAMCFGRDVRAAIFHRVGSFSAREVQHFGAPSLITRETNDVQQVQMLVLMGCTMMVAAPIMMVGGIVMAMREDIGLSWLVVVVGPGRWPSRVGLIVRQMVPSFRLMQERIDEVNRMLREQITGVRVVRAFVREEHETAAVRRGQRRAHRGRDPGRPLAGRDVPDVMLVANVAIVAVLWFGGHRVDERPDAGRRAHRVPHLPDADRHVVMMGTFMLMMIPRAAVCADRIIEVLDTESSRRAAGRRRSPRCPSAAPSTSRASSFTYPGAEEPVLRDVTLTRPARADGRRSSARPAPASPRCVNLVPRLFDATAGAVLRRRGRRTRPRPGRCCGRGSGWCRRRRSCSPAPSPTTCATASPTRPRRRCGRRSRSPRRVTSSSAMPERARAPIAQGGTNVSGGQRQRLAIARALIRRPEIYLFDDSFSALDLATDARLRAALRAGDARRDGA